LGEKSSTFARFDENASFSFSHLTLHSLLVSALGSSSRVVCNVISTTILCRQYSTNENNPSKTQKQRFKVKPGDCCITNDEREEGIVLRVVKVDREDDREGTEMGFAKKGREKKGSSGVGTHSRAIYIRN